MPTLLSLSAPRSALAVPLRRLAMPLLATLLLTGASAIALAQDIAFARNGEPSGHAAAAAGIPASVEFATPRR